MENQFYKEDKCLVLPTKAAEPGYKYHLDVGGGKFKTFIGANNLDLIAQAGADFIECDTMAQMRDLDSRQIWAIQQGYYKGVKLNGYYEKGDTQTPIQYLLSQTLVDDDGFSVISISDIKLEHDFGSYLDLSYLGFNNQNDSQVLINKGISYLSSKGGGTLWLNKPQISISGSIIFKDRVFIDSVIVTNVNCSASTNIAFMTSVVTENSLVFSNALNKNSNILNIDNNLQPGDFISIQTNKRFTEYWDGGNEIRPYYVNAQMFKVKEVSSSLQIILENKSEFDFTVENVVNVKTFKPSKFGGLNNVIINLNASVNAYSYGLKIDNNDSFKIGDIFVNNANVAGVAINKSKAVTWGNIQVKGGDNTLGLNYGVSINDGSFGCTGNKIEGDSCRHVISAGGTGYAIPMYNKFNFIIGRNSYSHTADCHANTMYFEYGTVVGNNGYSISGIGHKISKSILTGPSLQLAVEGGRDISFGDIYAENVNRITQNNSIKDSTFGDVIIKCRNLVASGTLGFRIGSSNNSFKSLSISNEDFLIGGTSTENDAILNNNCIYGITPQKGWRIGKYYSYGFPIGVFISDAGIRIDEAEIVNCGWVTSLTANDSAIYINYLASNSFIGKAHISITATALSLGSSRYIRANGGGPCTGLILQNISASGAPIGFGATIASDFVDVFFQNIRVPNGNNSSVLASGRFINNTIISDNLATIAIPGVVKQSAYSADTATVAAGANPTKAEFDALFAEFRDFKNKNRTSGQSASS